MPTLDFPEKYKAVLLRILKLYAKDYEIWAYGSRVKGTNHEASDLDLVIHNSNNPDEEFSKLEELRKALSESNIPIIVDVMDWARIPKHFRAEIEQHFVKIHF